MVVFVSEKGRVLVLTDLYRSRSAADDHRLEAGVLVHWDLPARSLKCFSQRCAALRSTVPNLFEVVAGGGGGRGGHCFFFVSKEDATSLR